MQALISAALGGDRPPTIVSFVERAPSAAERHRVLMEAAQALAAEGVLVLVDHNRPRQRAAALAALAGRPRVPGRTPAARWRRLAYPAARELQAAGFTVERLLLSASERVQIILARKRA